MWETKEYPINLIQGQSLEIAFDMAERDPTAPNDPKKNIPIPLTGYTGYSQVVDKNGNVVADLDVVIDEGAGRFTISMTDETSAALAVGVHLWDVVLEAPDGKREKPLWGDFAIKRGATIKRGG